jgi:hypothetical protein
MTAAAPVNIVKSFRAVEIGGIIDDGELLCTLRDDEAKVRALSEFIEVWNINDPLEVVSKRCLGTRWGFFNKTAFKNCNYNSYF